MSKKIKCVKAQESIGDHTPYLPTDKDTPKGKVYDEPGIIRTTSIVDKPLLETYTSDADTNRVALTDRDEIGFTTITKYDLITSLCRDGLPAYTFDTVFAFRWENATITLDVRDCSVLDMYRFPLPDQDRRGDFTTAHFLGLSTDSVSLPCKVDGVFKIVKFQHLKANLLLKAYFAKHREYAQNLTDTVNWIESMTDDEFDQFVREKVLNNEDFAERIKL